MGTGEPQCCAVFAKNGTRFYIVVILRIVNHIIRNNC